MSITIFEKDHKQLYKYVEYILTELDELKHKKDENLDIDKKKLDLEKKELELLRKDLEIRKSHLEQETTIIEKRRKLLDEQFDHLILQRETNSRLFT